MLARPFKKLFECVVNVNRNEFKIVIPFYLFDAETVKNVKMAISDKQITISGKFISLFKANELRA